MDLFEECIEALKDPKEILSDELTEQYFETLNNKFPITSWARIDWDIVPQKESIETYDDLYNWLKSQGIVDTTINLLWNPSDVPVVRTTLENALEVLDDVLAVGSDTFMYSDHGFVIEFFHDGEVTIGRTE